MAYNLPMQINLQSPAASNISSIKKSIQAGLSNIKVGVINTASFTKANAQVADLSNNFKKGQKSANSFFNAVEGKARSYAAYAVASTAILKLAGTVSQATREAIKYEKELINIAQTTGDSIKVTNDYASALVDISKKYNISLSKVAQLTRLLAQTGMGFRDAAKGAEILARTSLLAGFDNLQDTTEGLIATMQTFEVGVGRAGRVLESINTLSKKYAVESGDLVEAIRRAGAAFSTSGGQIEELLALFTAVRSTTRESAETISTGFRTIFARLQRPKTIEYFKQLGIELENAEGKFIGPYQAILKISEGLRKLGIEAGDVKFAEVVEQIGGIRQISRVVPLLEQVDKAQKALAQANNAGIDSVQDLEKAQQGLGYRLGVLQKEFAALISEVVNSSSFKFLADVFINLSKAVIQFTSALAPLMPFLATMAAWKISSGLGKLLSGGMNFKGISGLGMASGGLVPGSGNRDTVPAMLTPGEFVVRKSAVGAFGANNLAKINKYANGGYVKQNLRGINNQSLSWSDANESQDLSTSAKGSVKGVLFERFLRKRLGRPLGVDTYPDFKGLNKTEKGILGVSSQYNSAEAKLNKSGGKPTKDTAIVYAYAKGGSVGSDTVPALLTPGEFVVNKKSAQSFGYGNLKRINRYKKGGTVGANEGDISTDIMRGTGSLITSFAQMKKQFEQITKDLGAAGDAIRQKVIYKLESEEEAFNPETGRVPRGRFRGVSGGSRSFLGITKSVGTQSSLTHEIGHAADFMVGGGKKYASEQAGTLQNTLAKMAQDTIKQALQAKGMAQKDLDYRTSLVEIFADLFEKSEPEVRTILASTTDAKTGMEQIAKLFNEQPDKFTRLYADIQKNITGIKNTTAAAASGASPPGGKPPGGLGYPGSMPSGGGPPGGKPPGGLGYPGSMPSGGGPPGGPNNSVAAASKQVQTSFNSLSKAIKAIDINFVEFAAKAQIAVSALSAFAGLNVNQGALTTGTVKGAGFAAAGDLAGAAAGRFGSKQFATLSKGLNILGGIEVVGGTLDALFSTNFAAQRDNFIAIGDAAGAAAAATKAYAQEQYRSIPVIGGFLAALGAGSGATEQSLDATGKLVVSNARLEASINGVDKEVNKAKQAFSEAQAVGDVGKQQQAIDRQLDAADSLKKLATQNQQRASKAGGANAGTVAGGIAGGALAGAAIGSAVPIIGTALGAVTGAVVGGVASFVLSSKYSTEQIVKGYGLQADAIRKSGEIQAGLIGEFTSSLQTEAVRVTRAGGSYKDAIANITKQIGGENLNRILDGRKLGVNAKEDIKVLGEQSVAYDKRITALKEEQALISDKKLRAKIDAEIAAAETEQKKIDKLREGLISTEAAVAAEKKLIERRALEAAAMEYQIKVMKKLETAYDSFNAKSRELANISQEIENIGIGKLTQRQAAARNNVGSNLFEMDAKEIMRTPAVAKQMASLVTRGGGPGEEIIKAQQRLGAISKVGTLAKTGALGQINLASVEGAEKTSPQEIQERIYEKLGITKGADPILDESIRKYSEKIVQGGLSAAGQAEEEAREEATKLSEEIIRKQQEKLGELFQAEQKYRELEIEQINRRAELAKKVYENEKNYFEERFNLITKVQDFLQQEPSGPGKAGFLLNRGRNRRDVALAGLDLRRGAGFQGVGTEVDKFRQSIDEALAKRSSGEDVRTSFAEIQNESEKLITTIRDEIDIQGQYLDSLMESAKAQQEYTQALYDAQGDILRDIVTGTDKQRADSFRTLNAAAMAAMQGSFAGIPEDMRDQVFSVFDKFADVTIPGLGITGRDAQERIATNELMQMGQSQAVAQANAKKIVQRRVPVDERMADQIRVQEQKMLALLDEEKRVKNGLLKFEADNNKQFGDYVKEFGIIVAGMRTDLGTQMPAWMGTAASTLAANQTSMTTGAATGASTGAAFGPAGMGIGAAIGVADSLTGGAISSAAASVPGAFGFGANSAATNAQNQNAVNATATPAQQAEASRLDAKIAEQEKKRRSAMRTIDANSGFFGSGIQKNIAEKEKQNAEKELERLRRERSVYGTTPTTTAPNNPQNTNGTVTPATTGQQANNKPIQVQTQGQQEITVRLPDVQALVNQSITAMIFETVGSTFNSIAEGVRTANNFEDAANAIVQASSQTTTKNMGGQK